MVKLLLRGMLASEHSATSHDSIPLGAGTIGAHATRHVDAGADEITSQLDAAAMNCEGLINIIPINPDSVGQGTWASATATTSILNISFANTTYTNGDNCSFKIFLSKGTYTMEVLYYKFPDGGIVDFDIDATEVGSVDMYAASDTRNQKYTVTGISIAGSGIKTFRVRVDGKNASSTSYYCYLNCVRLWRTA